MNSRINFFVVDVDGTLTDGKIYMGANGEVMKSFDVKDGYGIHDILIPKGIIPIVITGRSSSIVENRCNELGINVLFQKVEDKLGTLNQYLKENDGELSDVAIIGDDLNDLSCMLAVKAANGLIGCPLNACKEIIEISDFVSQYNGGFGAVREFIDYIMDVVS